jgi:hypothetical protein
MGFVRAATFLGICAMMLRAQGPVPVEYACPEDDIETFGLTCLPDDPCAVFLELSSVQSTGLRLFVSGNLHTASTTLYGILLMSEDAGKTWMEPHPRIRSAALEQMQFLDLEHGWIAGQLLEPLPKDPFLLVTTDGGKSWRQQPVFEESLYGSVARFWFDSATTGELVFDQSQGTTSHYELLETHTGGANWEPRETSSSAPRLKNAPAKPETSWRVRADGATKTNKLERSAGATWEAVASFPVHVADCK